jgi:hypothetical protein
VPAASRSGQDATRFVIVAADSVPLYAAPDEHPRPAKYVRATLQLEVLDVSPDSLWYEVKIGEQKGYQLSHGERYWVRAEDVISPAHERAAVSVDLSLLEVPTGNFTRRVTSRSFISSRGRIEPPFYVSAVYRNYNPTPTCSPPLSVCAMIYRPGAYFLDTDEPEEVRRTYDRLYNNGTLRPLYAITAPLTIRTLRTKVVLARVIMEDAGCYARAYLGTEVVTLSDTVRAVDAPTATGSSTIDTALLFARPERGDVQYVNVMYVFQLAYADSTREVIVRRLAVSWPWCM